MHNCDLLVNIGARFDDRVTGRLDAFSPNSKKVQLSYANYLNLKNMYILISFLRVLIFTPKGH